MIYIIDSFIDGNVLSSVTSYLKDGDFKKEVSGGKK